MKEFSREKLENYIGIKFNDDKYYRIALTHSSYAKQYKSAQYNERLEFLGDSVLQLTITGYLFEKFKHKSEGELTKLRSLIVCESSLYEVAQKLNISKTIRLSKGEALTGGRERVSIQADAVEAIIAAIYLDKGFEEAKKFILDRFSEIIDKAINHKVILDFKTELQEYLQKNGDVNIEYKMMKFEGPPHRRKFFLNVYVEDKLYGEGTGFSKKEAEQNAAKQALIKLEVINE